MQLTWTSRILMWVLSLVIGVLYGAAGTVTHSITTGGFPTGLVLSIVAVAALLIAVRCFTPGRVSTVICGGAMVVVTTVLSGVGPGGSIIVPDTPLGRIWIWALAAIVLFAVSWPDMAKVRATQAANAGAAAGEPRIEA